MHCSTTRCATYRDPAAWYTGCMIDFINIRLHDFSGMSLNPFAGKRCAPVSPELLAGLAGHRISYRRGHVKLAASFRVSTWKQRHPSFSPNTSQQRCWSSGCYPTESKMPCSMWCGRYGKGARRSYSSVTHGANRIRCPHAPKGPPWSPAPVGVQPPFLTMPESTVPLDTSIGITFANRT